MNHRLNVRGVHFIINSIDNDDDKALYIFLLILISLH